MAHAAPIPRQSWNRQGSCFAPRGILRPEIPHGGGFLPSYADRSDHACMVGPKGCNPDVKLSKAPTEYLKQIYFD
jgi:hypothetical protein